MKIPYLLCLFGLYFASLFSTETHDKWIVITTINYPTAAVKKLATLPDWHLLVVADKKTPLDWSLPNCTFLSVEKQLELELATVKILPWNHYGRKMVGYLWAIAHGAEYIYETDDDNHLLDTISIFPENGVTNVIAAVNSAVNIYSLYGQPSVWPRGFPLSRVTERGVSLTLSQQSVSIGIEQGLVNKDPDVDAIFRLTRNEEIYFKDGDPCALAVGTFCPFNTQNTLFHKKAFWSLWLPSFCSFRVCDIWRGYIAQRLLWETDQLLLFRSPTAYQERNPHNLLKDFADETALYLQAETFIQALLNWSSSLPSVPLRFQSLVANLVTQGLLSEKEENLLQAWLTDLEKVGYTFPAPLEAQAAVIAP